MPNQEPLANAFNRDLTNKQAAAMAAEAKKALESAATKGKIIYEEPKKLLNVRDLDPKSKSALGAVRDAPQPTREFLQSQESNASAYTGWKPSEPKANKEEATTPETRDQAAKDQAGRVDVPNNAADTQYQDDPKVLALDQAGRVSEPEKTGKQESALEAAAEKQTEKEKDAQDARDAESVNRNASPDQRKPADTKAAATKTREKAAAAPVPDEPRQQPGPTENKAPVTQVVQQPPISLEAYSALMRDIDALVADKTMPSSWGEEQKAKATSRYLGKYVTDKYFAEPVAVAPPETAEGKTLHGVPATIPEAKDVAAPQPVSTAEVTQQAVHTQAKKRGDTGRQVASIEPAPDRPAADISLDPAIAKRASEPVPDIRFSGANNAWEAMQICRNERGTPATQPDSGQGAVPVPQRPDVAKPAQPMTRPETHAEWVEFWRKDVRQRRSEREARRPKNKPPLRTQSLEEGLARTRPVEAPAASMTAQRMDGDLVPSAMQHTAEGTQAVQASPELNTSYLSAHVGDANTVTDNAGGVPPRSLPQGHASGTRPGVGQTPVGVGITGDDPTKRINQDRSNIQIGVIRGTADLRINGMPVGELDLDLRGV